MTLLCFCCTAYIPLARAAPPRASSVRSCPFPFVCILVPFGCPYSSYRLLHIPVLFSGRSVSHWPYILSSFALLFMRSWEEAEKARTSFGLRGLGGRHCSELDL
ncbi:hypothetical protein C8T65DRAFT_44053 [Cerioporus squamosus]|nr:hypothetical protein C8T65DRAFT_44053 [Cerioporus squamosus]